MAYDRTVEATGKVSFAYIDKILAAWAAKGITTVQAAEADRNAGSNGNTGTDNRSGRSKCNTDSRFGES